MKKLLLIAALAAIALNVSLWGQSITVTSPTAGNEWCPGSTHTITWTKSGAMQDVVAIRLRYEGSSGDAALQIVDSTPNDGSYSWTIPASVAPGNYYIRIRTVDTAVSDDSPIFKIVNCPASITVTVPNGTSDWKKGSTHTITWTKSGTMQDVVAIRLRYEGSSGDAALQIVDSTPNDGSYSWTIPNSVTPGNYYIRVRTVDTVVSGDSAIFSISQGEIIPGLKEKLKQRRYWEIKWPPDPDPCLCPEWKIPVFDDFREFLGSRFGGSIVLMKNGAKLQELAQFGGKRTLPGSVKANLSRQDFNLLKNGGAKFSIAILDSNGSILNESELQQGAQQEQLR